MPPALDYRPFRNDDPPRLVAVWKAAATGRGAAPLRHGGELEGLLFARPYFDPLGLILACDGPEVVGFAHAGFGPSPDERDLCPGIGVVCAVLVRPSHQRRGIGTELLRRCEQYLAGRGATEVLAGAMPPDNPFYTGLYGGASAPGFLDSDEAAAPFFRRRGYADAGTCRVLQKRLAGAAPADGRFMDLRKRFEFQVVPNAPPATWWKECTQGPLDPHEFRLADRQTGLPVARLLLWEMPAYGTRWGSPSVGILDVQVRPDLRRQGLAKCLLAQSLRLVQEQYIELAEVQVPEENAAALGLCRSLGFAQVDTGRVFRRTAAPQPSPV